MKKMMSCCAALLAAALLSGPVSASPLEEGEKKVFAEAQAVIPKDKIKTVEDLHAKWQEVQEGKSKALIIDIRTEPEFDAGHILNSSNMDSGHVYTLPKKVEDANAELWIVCRTKNRVTYFVSMLYRYGYKNVYAVEGGIEAWAKKGYPLVTKYLGTVEVKEYQKEVKETFQFRENK